MVPILLKPKLLACKNSIFHRHSNNRLLHRELVLISLSLFIISVTYSGSASFFFSIRGMESVLLIHPTPLVSTFLAMIFILLCLSSCIAALGSLFTSKDLDLLLSSPIKQGAFLFGKGWDVFQNSAWMVLVFAFPTLLAYIRTYQFSVLEVCTVFLLFLVFIFIPVLLGMAAALLLAYFFQVRKLRRFLFLVAILTLVAVFALVQVIGAAPSTTERLTAMAKLIGYLQSPFYQYLPSHWLAVILGEMAHPVGITLWPYLLALFSFCLLAATSTTLLLQHTYIKTYSNTQQRNGSTTINSKVAHRFLRILFGYLPLPTQALLAKEIKTFTRDIGQALQLVLLIGLCALYVYNFGTISLVADKTSDSIPWSVPILIVVNYCMGCFVTSAICSRFVFPSISLEGKSYWYLASAPLTDKQIVMAKFKLWFWPVASIASVILTSGALAVQAPIAFVVATSIAAIIATATIVALAIGLGGLFANFEWEHASQLSANFGSLLFMLCSMMLVLASLFPLSIAVFLYFICEIGLGIHLKSLWSFFTLAGFIYCYLHIFIARWSLNAGIRALEKLRQ